MVLRNQVFGWWSPALCNEEWCQTDDDMIYLQKVVPSPCMRCPGNKGSQTSISSEIPVTTKHWLLPGMEERESSGGCLCKHGQIWGYSTGHHLPPSLFPPTSVSWEHVGASAHTCCVVSTERTPFLTQEMEIWVRSTRSECAQCFTDQWGCCSASISARREEGLVQAEEHCIKYNSTEITTSPHILLRRKGNLNILQV